MSHADAEAGQPAGETKSAVRSRRPERRQMAMVVQCPDDLVGPIHPVRRVMAVVEKLLELARLGEPIKVREGIGRDATDAQLLVALWLYACIRGIGSAREVARRGEDSAAYRWGCAAG